MKMNAVFVFISHVNDTDIKNIWNYCVQVSGLKERAIIKVIEFKDVPSIYTLNQKLRGLQKYFQVIPSIFVLSGKAYNEAMANDIIPPGDQIDCYNAFWSTSSNNFIYVYKKFYNRGLLDWIEYIEIKFPNWFNPLKILPFKEEELYNIASMITLSPFWATVYTNKSGFKVEDPKIIGSTYLDTLRERLIKINTLDANSSDQQTYTYIIEELHYLGLMDYFFLHRNVAYYQKLITYHLNLLIGIHIL